MMQLKDTISKTGSWPSLDTEPFSALMVDFPAFRTKNACLMVFALAIGCFSLSYGLHAPPGLFCPSSEFLEATGFRKLP